MPIALVSAGLALGACRGGAEPDVEVDADAVAQASRAVGGGVHGALALPPADVALLARQANVDRQVIGPVAASLAESAVWRGSMVGVREIYDSVPDGVDSTLVDVACESAAGTKVHTDYQLHYAIFPRVNGFNTAEIDGFTEAAVGLFTVLYDAQDSDRPAERTAAVLTCRVLDAATG